MAKTPYVYYLTADYSAGSGTVATVAVIKRALPLDSSVPLQLQLVILNLPGGPGRTGQETVAPSETLYLLMRMGLSPYFESYTRGESDQTVRRGKGIDDAKTGRCPHSNLPLTPKAFP